MNALRLDPASQQLLNRLRRRRRWIAGSFALVMGTGFGFYMCSLVLARDFLGRPLWEGTLVTRAIAVSAGFIALCLGVALAYVRVSERWLQPLSRELRAHVYGD